ncbi:MAG TPA: ABC transporter permease [Synergistaceae bacterium]|nr:ABC transporter permease [Synergistaceae bacterium]
MWDNLSLVFNVTLIHATLRASTPILFATLTCILTQQADILNIGVEGIMLCGAFTAVATSYLTGSWVLALAAAMGVGVLIAAIMGFAHLKYKADIFVVGMAINMLALAVTRFLLQKVLHTSGSFYDSAIVPLPRLHFDFLSGNEVINTLFNNYSLFEPLGILLVFVLQWILYRTVWGLRLRSVGLHPLAASTVGIHVFRRKFEVMLYSGLLGGMAGAYLSLGYSRLFAENMTNGRGFMGVAAMFFGGGDPIRSWIGCLIFGFTDSVGSRLQSLGLPSQFILMIPYVATISVLSLAMIRKSRKEKKAQSSLKISETKQ